MRLSDPLRIAAVCLALALLAGIRCPIVRGDDKEKPKKEDKKEKIEPWVEIRTAHFIVASDGGEKAARRVADQFELLCRVFQDTMPNARLNAGVPIQILAAKDGQSFAKVFPEFPFDKRHPQPNGLFVAGPEKTFIGIRTTLFGPPPYEDIFRDYGRLVLKLSYRPLPPWLEEGYSEVYGSMTLTDKGASLGKPEPDDMSTLYESPLLPLNIVFHVDRDSPYYTVGEKTTMYFAESRALVHFLLTDPQSTDSKSLEKYITQVEAGTDALQAAKEVFGDLNQLQSRLEAYIKQPNGAPTQIATAGSGASAGPVKTLSNAETEARMGDFLANRGKREDAQEKLEDALKLDPSVVEAEQSLGYLALHQNELDDAEKHFTRATELDPNDALSYYGEGLVAMTRGGFVGVPVGAVVNFEKTISLIPDFAPAWYNLASIYALRPETLQKALTDAQRAASLAPGESGYQLQVANLKQSLGRTEEVRKTPVQIPASNPNAVDKAENLAAAQQQNPVPSVPANSAGVSPSSDGTLRIENKTQPGETRQPALPAAPPAVPNPSPPAAISSQTHVYSMVGTITDVVCANAPQIQITLKAQTIVMHLHADDLGQVGIKSAGSNALAKNTACASLRGRNARVSYSLVSGKKWDGELQIVEFR